MLSAINKPKDRCKKITDILFVQIVETPDFSTKEDSPCSGGDGGGCSGSKQFNDSTVGGTGDHVRATALLLPRLAPRRTCLQGRCRSVAQEDRGHARQHRLPGRAALCGSAQPFQATEKVP